MALEKWIPEGLSASLADRFWEAKDNNNFYTATCFLLIDAGWDPNDVVDEHGNTPLHLVAKLDVSTGRRYSDNLNKTAHLLLDYGAQLSLKNANGETAVDLWIEKNERNCNKDADQGIIERKLPDWCTELPKLMSLSARVIRHNRIPYFVLPTSLIAMIEKHEITIK